MVTFCKGVTKYKNHPSCMNFSKEMLFFKGCFRSSLQWSDISFPCQHSYNTSTIKNNTCCNKYTIFRAAKATATLKAFQKLLVQLQK